MLLVLLLVVAGLALVLYWGSAGHIHMTRDAIDSSLARLSLQEVEMFGVKKKETLKEMLAWLPLYNTSADVEWCNIAGKGAQKVAKAFKKACMVEEANGHRHSCAVKIGGDQVTHFMQSFDIESTESYNRSKRQIYNYVVDGWELLNEAAPKGKKGFFNKLKSAFLGAGKPNPLNVLVAGALGDALEEDVEHTGKSIALAPLASALKNISKVVNPIDVFNQGLKKLGEGMHTLQDSYAPGHVCRDKLSSYKIKYVFAFDDINNASHEDYAAKFPHSPGHPFGSDWAGHHHMDNYTLVSNTKLVELATKASTSLLSAVLENIGKRRSKLESALGVVLGQSLDTKLVKDPREALGRGELLESI